MNHCLDCQYYKYSPIFDGLCLNQHATYSIAGKVDQHSIVHMRENACGLEGRFFVKRREKSNG